MRIGGMAKGSGMIHPDMATMLGFFSCDAGVDAGVWQGWCGDRVNGSFNAITVDGDTSTNEPCWPSRQDPSWPASTMPFWEQGLTQAMQQLAQAIARDGEGATVSIEVQVEGRGMRARRCRWRARLGGRPW